MVKGPVREETIRALATPESFARGRSYFDDGAVSDLIRRGDRLTAEVEGQRVCALRGFHPAARWRGRRSTMQLPLRLGRILQAYRRGPAEIRRRNDACHRTQADRRAAPPAGSGPADRAVGETGGERPGACGMDRGGARNDGRGVVTARSESRSATDRCRSRAGP